MRSKYFAVIIGICAFSIITFGFSADSFVVANAIQVYKPVKAIEGFSVKAQTSAGSVENLRKTDAGRQQMSVVYSGHVWLGRNGQMKMTQKNMKMF